MTDRFDEIDLKGSLPPPPSYYDANKPYLPPEQPLNTQTVPIGSGASANPVGFYIPPATQTYPPQNYYYANPVYPPGSAPYPGAGINGYQPQPPPPLAPRIIITNGCPNDATFACHRAQRRRRITAIIAIILITLCIIITFWIIFDS